MTYKAFGARCDSCQIHRIEAGFQELGLTESITPDFIFSNDAGTHDEAISYRNDISPNSKLILNVLDIPVHLGDNFDYEKLRQQLLKADQVTTISEFVQKQVLEIYNIPSTIIYQPIMNIYKKYEYFEKLPYKFMHVGRRYDFNKFFNLAVGALNLLGIDENKIAIVGSETVPYGRNVGILTEEYLNLHYNSVDFVMVLSKTEGICLPAIEAMAAGTIPVACNHLTTMSEFLPQDFFPEYYKVEPNTLSVAKFMDQFLMDDKKMESFKRRIHFFYKEYLEEHFSPIGVAQKLTNLIRKDELI